MQRQADPAVEYLSSDTRAINIAGHVPLCRRYVLDNRQVVRISTTSFSSPSIADSARAPSGSPDLARRIAHTEWARRKHVAAQRKREEEERAARMRQEETERTAREKEEKARLEKENFLKWVEGKRRQELDRKAMLENELALQKRLKEIEDKAAVAKALYLRQWIHKKQDEQKGARRLPPPARATITYVRRALRGKPWPTSKN